MADDRFDVFTRSIRPALGPHTALATALACLFACQPQTESEEVAAAVEPVPNSAPIGTEAASPAEGTGTDTPAATTRERERPRSQRIRPSEVGNNPQLALRTFYEDAPSVPIIIRSALAQPSRSGTVELTFSSVPLNCRDISSRGTLLSPGDVVFRVRIAQPLLDDGDSWHVYMTSFSASTVFADQGPTPISRTDTVLGHQTIGSLDLSLTARSGRVLRVEGDFNALGCPDDNSRQTISSNPQGVAVHFGSVAVPMTGATLVAHADPVHHRDVHAHGATHHEGHGGDPAAGSPHEHAAPPSPGTPYRLILSSEPRDCRAAYDSGAYLDIRLVVMESGEARIENIVLAGHRLPGDPLFQRAVLGDAMPSLSLLPGSSVPDALAFTISGELTAFGRPLRLEGEIAPVHCEPR